MTIHYLAIDLGAESGRTMVGALADDKLTLCETHRFANTPVRLPDGLRWDVLHLWHEVKAGIALAARRFPLASLGVDGWGNDFALLDRNGALMGNPFHYRDSRVDGMFDVAFQRVPRQQIFAQTGIQFMQINTLYQLLAMVTAQSPTLEAAQTFLTIPDLFNYWLSGERCCEFTNATTTQCFDPQQRTWALDLLAALGIPTNLFGAVCEPGTWLANLSAGVAAEIGVPAIPVIAPACHDTGSAVVAVPAESADFAWISSGTWSILGCEAAQPAMDARALAYNFTNEGGVFGTWRVSKNIMGLWLVQECRRTWQQQGEDLSYDDLTHLAAAARPFLAVLDPDDDSFLLPGDMPARIRQYCARTAQTVPQTKGEIVRVALEGIALKYRLVLERMEEITGKHFTPIHIVGGGSRNQLLNQFTADSTRRPVVAGPVEATAIGNILMQSVTLGELGSLADARRVVRASFAPAIFHPAPADAWDTAYQRIKEVMST